MVLPTGSKTTNISYLWIRKLLTILFACLILNLTDAALEISTELLTHIEKKYGIIASERIRHWQQIIASSTNLSEEEKLKVVNDFFNQLEFVEDIKKWGVEDYWATPFEFLAVNGGDCEDFSIAKYFTLIEIGISEEKLRMTYVKALQYNQAHMVLTYFPSPQAIPLVLDNLNPHILPAAQREDLLPVYSFNGVGLWIAKSVGSGKQVGNSDRLSLWQEIKSRMQSKTETAKVR